ncbi:MAG: hypothetical protein EPN26_13200 [Rhodospirillales bacterium]|nr:MAG: hypothetical protein EPN26_13200 [Rhodospirillales bacterium]
MMKRLCTALLILCLGVQTLNAQESGVNCGGAITSAEKRGCADKDNLCRQLAPLLKSYFSIQTPPSPFIERLARAYPRILQIDASKNKRTLEGYRQHLSKQYRVSTQLDDALKALGDDSLSYSFRHIRGSSLHAVESLQGTGSCQRLVLFEANSAREAKFIDLPEYARYDDCPFGGVGAGYSSAWLGSIEGQTAFISEDTFSDLTRIYLSPFVNSAWGETCEIDIGFPIDIKLAESFCQAGRSCIPFNKVALPLARAFKKDKTLSSFLSEPEPSPEALSMFDRMRLLAPNPDSDIVAQTFGRAISTSYEVFEWGSPVLPVMVNGRVYLARVGRAILGWRVSEDIWVGFYELVEEQLAPVASALVTPLRQGNAQISIRKREDHP